MVTIQEALDPCEVSSELPWEELYVFLHTVAQRLVSSLHIPAWYGQEEDIVQDIVQETVARMIERVQEAKRGERVPVRSLKSMMVVVARNYCRDLRRHDHRLVHVPSNGYFARNIAVTPDDQAIPEDIAIENVFQEELFLVIAHEIASFPLKQRQAICADLASRMAFEREPTKLQQAFLEVGIQIQEYQSLLPDDSLKRKRHASLVSYAYRRIGHLHSVEKHTSAECSSRTKQRVYR